MFKHLLGDHNKAATEMINIGPTPRNIVKDIRRRFASANK